MKANKLYRKFILSVGLLLMSGAFFLGQWTIQSAWSGPAGVSPGAPVSGKTRSRVLRAPEIKKGIGLKSEDQPVDVTLLEWFCTIDDKKIDIFKEINLVLSRMPDSSKLKFGDMLSVRVRMDSRWLTQQIEFYDKKPLTQSFPSSILEESPVMSGLDANPGTTQTYTRQFCYTNSELRRLKKAFLDGLDKKLDEILARAIR